MTRRSDSYTELRRLLSLTRDDELDCDRFSELMAPWLDGSVKSPELVALIEHHRQLCLECDEQLSILERALGREAPRN
jgi:hypothetical protein